MSLDVQAANLHPLLFCQCHVSLTSIAYCRRGRQTYPSLQHLARTQQKAEATSLMGQAREPYTFLCETCYS